MNSSGMKRGLAASAISALAVAGLPLLASSASANPMVDQLASGAVVLYTPQDGGAASIKNDGQNTTVHLVANAGSDATQIRFEFGVNPAGPFTTIATVGRSNGVFSTEWTPPTSVYNLPVHVRAVAINNVGTDATVDDNTVNVTSNQDAIDLSEAAGSAVGVFQQPYAGPNDMLLGAASATTSDVADDPAVTFSAPYGGSVNAEDTVGAPANGTRSVSGPVDYTGYDFGTATDVDQAIELANVGGSTGGSDAEAVTLYKQTITTVTAAAAKPTVQAGGKTAITVTVTDQNGKPVVGAEVFQDDNQDNAGDGAAQYTNSQGQAVFANEGGSTNGTTHYFFVNTTGTVTYENGTDFKRSATVTEYSPAAASITATSADGAAFDDDEYAAGDITAVVKDQNGNGMANQVVRYAWTVTPFDATTGYPKTLPEGSATTGADGVATIPFPTSEPSGTYVLHTYINQDGTPGQQSGDLGGTDLTVEAGQADIVWADGSVAQAASNTTKTFEGALELEDGTGLPGRNISINWTPTGDAVVAAQSAQPAGTTRTGNTSATTATDKDGSFGVALTDPPATGTPPTPANEKGGALTASTANTPKIGNAGDSSSLQVDFLKSTGPVNADDITVSADDLIDGMATPGRPVDLDISVENADGDTLTDYPVTVTVDHGFLSPNAETASALKADPAPAEGGLYGEWASVGTTKELSTDDSGKTGIVAAIEDDKGFDTNDTVTTTVTIKAGDVTKKVTLDFVSESPLNGGALKIERAAAAQQTVTVLPKAPTAESVYYNVFTTDQFGNLVEGEDVDLTDNLAGADVNGDENNGSAVSQLKNDAPALELDSNVAGDQTVSGSWTTDTNTWTDSLPLTPAFDAARKTVTDGKTLKASGDAVNWYVIDFAHSTYSMTHDTTDTVKVGTTVLETYKAVDQMGEPIRNVTVKFFRSGPDTYQDGDYNSAAVTNEAGEASYVFSGAKAGTATVQGLITDFSPLGGDQIVPESRATDQVTFVGDSIVSPEVKLQGRDNGAKADKLKVNAINAASGAVVKLFKMTKSGALKLVGESTLNQYGNHKFTVADKNGNEKTTYVAKVAKTNKTSGGKASKSVR